MEIKIRLMIFLIVASIIIALFSHPISKKLGLVDKSYWGVTHVIYEDSFRRMEN